MAQSARLMELAPADALVLTRQETRCVSQSTTSGLGTSSSLVRARRSHSTGSCVTARYVNQAPVTGESLPAEKTAGDSVFGGTINGRSALDVEVTRLRSDSTLARIIHLVERAQAQRAPSQAFVDRFARVYTPIVLALAIAVAIVPPLLFGALVRVVLPVAGSLVISCPCALVISTPVSVVSGLAAAARKGVLIKGGAHLEKLASVSCIAFDKTGTLTTGRLRVSSVLPVNGTSASALLRSAASLEGRSEHPIGRAILDTRERKGSKSARLSTTRVCRAEGPKREWMAA